jgi:glutamate-ammonia-ligase adenylyltransferase
MSPPPEPSAADLEELRAFSPAAARRLQGPRDLQALLRPPNPRALHRYRPPSEAAARLTLRRARKRMFLNAAWRECQGEDPLTVAYDWARFADAAVDVADRAAFAALVEKRGAPTGEDGRPIHRAILALGKHGSLELNPSSDTDVLFVYGTDRGDPTLEAPHPWFTRWARRVRALLADVDENGFVFRVDLDLRPEGTTGPIVNSLDALEGYYESFGRTWERAALTRLRQVAGDRELGDELVHRLRPFVYPRSLNHRVIDDLADMKSRITASAGEGFDVKRGHGGIREVEFVAQSLQLLHGGRRPSLRGGDTASLLARLERAGLLSHQRAAALTDGYRALRRVEHALQYFEDRQTQTLPDEGPVPERLSAAGIDLDQLEEHREIIHAIFAEVLAAHGEAPDEGRALAEVATDPVRERARRITALDALGFDGPRAIDSVLRLERRRGSPFAPAQRARPGLASLAPGLLVNAARSADPDRSLSHLADLFSGFTHRSFLERLDRDPRLGRQLTRILAESAPLTRALARQGALAPVLVEDDARRPTAVGLDRALASVPLDDEELALIHMRRVTAVETLRAALAFLDGAPVLAVENRLSAVADAILRRALDLAIHKVSRRAGTPSEGGWIVIGAMGRLGGRELGFFADLDIIFVHDASGDTDGRKTMSAGEWVAKVAQQVIWMVSAPLGEGRCFEVDTRLRPSGSQGPLCITRQAFLEHHERRSAVWERQALTRFRPVAGERAAGRALARAARRTIALRDPAGLGPALTSMLDRVHAERGPKRHEVDVKLGPGGQLDIAFLTQGFQLAAGDPGAIVPQVPRGLVRAARAGFLTSLEARGLIDDYRALAWLRERLAILDDQRPPRFAEGDARLRAIGRVTDRTAADLFSEAEERRARVRDVCRAAMERLPD